MTQTPTNPAPRELWLALRYACGLSTRRLADLTGKHSTSVLRATPAAMWEMLPANEQATQTADARAYLEAEQAAAHAAPTPEPAPELEQAPTPEPTPEPAPAPRNLPHLRGPAPEVVSLGDVRPPVFTSPPANAGWGNLTKGRKPSGLQTRPLWLTGKAADLATVKEFLAQFGPRSTRVAGLILREAAEQSRKAPQRALDPLPKGPERVRIYAASTPDAVDTFSTYLAEHGPDLGRAALALLYAEAAAPSRTVAEYLAAVAKPARRR